MKWILALLLLSFLAVAAEPESAASIDSRLAFVDKLLTQSSAARQVKASDNAKAGQLYATASNQYQAAVAARADGNLQDASNSLSSAIRSMYAAVDASNDRQATSDRSERTFERRLDSVNALLDAHDRITDEKGIKSVHLSLLSSIDKDLATAKKLNREGDAPEARAHLDLVYQAVIQAVEELRQGETLVRQLKFESDEDEYRYEVDRNDTHKMLVNLLVENQSTPESNKERSRERVAAADQLRRNAEELADDGKYAQAITVLEQSTSELVKAIRGAGIYIPG